MARTGQEATPAKALVVHAGRPAIAGMLQGALWLHRDRQSWRYRDKRNTVARTSGLAFSAMALGLGSAGALGQEWTLGGARFFGGASYALGVELRRWGDGM